MVSIEGVALTDMSPHRSSAFAPVIGAAALGGTFAARIDRDIPNVAQGADVLRHRRGE
jgi:hypothetical protein